jgi:Tol biopolymer transport system component
MNLAPRNPAEAAAVLLLALVVALPAAGSPGEPALRPPQAISQQGTGTNIDFMTPRGKTRLIEFTTTEATNVSVNASPDGRWLLIDLLGHIWRVPIAGGKAQVMTHGSGVALNFHPRYSPDGRQIAFISDRSGQNNVWVMNADGSAPRALLLDPETRFTDPVWAPDGRSVVVVRAYKTPGRSWHRQNETLWRLFLDGSPPVEIKSGRSDHYTMPAFAPDGKSLYFNLAFSTGRGTGLLNAGSRVLRYEFASGKSFNLDGSLFTGLSPEFQAALDATGYAEVTAGAAPPAMSALPSPDGRYLAFAREVPGETFDYRGHSFGPRTTLYLRDLHTGAERRLIPEAAKDLTRMNAQYSYRPFPAFAWSADGHALFANYRGQIQRIDVATGRATPIPFSADVSRVASEQTRGNWTIDDRKVTARLLRSPTVSPDGRRAAFEAFGRIWVMDMADRKPRPLADSGPDGQQLTPAFSPDGTQIAFSTWSEARGGRLWQVPAGGGAPVPVSSASGAYLHPAWSKDSRRLLATWRALPAAPAGGHRTAGVWTIIGDWSVVSIDVASGVQTEIAPIVGLRPAHFADDGSVVVEVQRDPAALGGLGEPFPPQASLDATSLLKVVAPDGTSRELLSFAARTGRSNRWNLPAVSPDGKRLVWSAGGKIFLSAVESAHFAPGTPFDPDPNIVRAGVTEITGDRGGDDPRWRDSSTIDFVSADRLMSYDVRTGTLRDVAVELTIPRVGGTQSLLLKGATLIPMAGDRPAVVGDLRVVGSRIACVFTCAPAPGDRIVDVRGKFILPGYIDVHAHHLDTGGPTRPGIFWQRHAFDLDLAFGVTTIADPAIDAASAFSFAQAVEAGVVRGPRVFASSDHIAGQSTTFNDNQAINSLDDARFEVGRRARFGALEIKNYRVARREQQQWLAQASREVPITLTAEGGPLLADVGMALDGQTGWEHIIADLPLYADASTFFGKAGINYSPTVIVAGHVNGAKEYWRPRQDLAGNSRYRRFADPERQKLETIARPLPPKSEFSFPIVAEGLADIIRAGGTGTLGEHGEQPGIGTHWEIWSYSEALTLIEALRVATIHPARFLGLDRELGSLEVGKLADLQVLDANPLDDIRNTLGIRYVMRGGVLLETETLQPVVPR